MFSSIAHSFFTTLTAEMVNDLNHTHRKTPKLTISTSKSLETLSDNQTATISNQPGMFSPPPFYRKRPIKLPLNNLKVIPKRQPLSQPIFNCRTSTLPASQEQHPTLPKYSTANTSQPENLTSQNDNLVDHTSVNDDTDSPIKVYSKTNYPFPPLSF